MPAYVRVEKQQAQRSDTHFSLVAWLLPDVNTCQTIIGEFQKFSGLAGSVSAGASRACDACLVQELGETEFGSTTCWRRLLSTCIYFNTSIRVCSC